MEGQYDSWNTSLDNNNCSISNKNEHPGRLNSVTKLKIRPIEPQLQTKISILIVDRKYSLAVELKDDSKDTSDKAMGLASYSNSKSTVSSYVSIVLNNPRVELFRIYCFLPLFNFFVNHFFNFCYR